MQAKAVASLGTLLTEGGGGGSGGVDGAQYFGGAHLVSGLKEIVRPTFNLNVHIIQNELEYQHPKRFKPVLLAPVHGPTKVVTFGDGVSELHPVSRARIGNVNALENLNVPSGKPPRYGENVED